MTRVQPGDEVLLSYANCAECGYCKMGRPAGCVGFMDRNFGRVRNPSVGAAPVGTLAGTDIPVHGEPFGNFPREGRGTRHQERDTDDEGAGIEMNRHFFRPERTRSALPRGRNFSRQSLRGTRSRTSRSTRLRSPVRVSECTISTFPLRAIC